jgi:hypothetical protein
LGEVLHIGQTFTLGGCFENCTYTNSPNFWATHFLGKSYVLIWTKTGLDHILGDFFGSNASGHPGRDLGRRNRNMFYGQLRDFRPMDQGCQMVCFQTKNPKFG